MKERDKEMTKRIKHIAKVRFKCCVRCGFAAVLMGGLLLLTSCSDDLFGSGDSDGTNGMQLNISTIEMADDLVSIGGTRSSGQAASSDKNDNYLAHMLQGYNPYSMKAHRMPLPLVGIHSKAANAGHSTPYSQTRASINDIATTTNFHDSLTVWGFTDSDLTLYDQILVKKITNWRTGVQWPYRSGDSYMKFYALSPSLESTDVTVTTDPAYETKPQFRYKLPDTAGEMVDLLYGESSNISIQTGPTGTTAGDPWQENLGKDNKIIDMQFRHILTAVRFSQGVIPAGLTITNIELQGVPTTAEYNPNTIDLETGTDGAWSDWTGNASFSIDTNFEGSAGSSVYIDNNQVFFVLPQTVGSGVRLNITLVDNNTSSSKTHTLSCSLAGDVWKKGYTVNYMITIGEVEEGYYFVAEAAGQEVEHSNSISNGSFILHSYHNYKDYSTGTGVDVHHTADWSVSGYSTTEDGTYLPENKPDWIRDVTGVSTGHGDYAGGDNATVNFSLNPQSPTKEANHQDVLGTNTLIGAGIDLSTHDPNGNSYGTTETANCYIINRVGTYSFPLVYGNKTANGTENACFKDHTGATISHKLIKDQIEAKNSGFTYELIEGNKYKKVSYEWDAAAYASDGGKFLQGELVWQDVASLISSVSATSSDMSFAIGVSKPGNAVLALKARKKITYYTYDGENYNFDSTQGSGGYGVEGTWETLWTWHIWMTDEVFSNNGGSYDKEFLDHKEGNATPHDHIISLKHTDDSEVAKILPVNLGWVPDEMDFEFYSPRSAWVELKQEGSNKTIHAKITQHARQPLVTGTGTFYQWGRPTPFPAVLKLDGTARPIYDIENNDISADFELAAATDPGDAISKPFYVLQGTPRGDPNGPQDSWFDVASDVYNTALWSTASKTVYDPCPRGFRMPAASVFYGFTQTMATVESEDGKLNMYPEVNGQKNGERSKGGYFYVKEYTDATNPDRYYEMVYMPATGQFHGNKTIGNKLNAASGSQLDTANGIYWTSDYFDTGSAGTEKAKRQGCGLWITPEQTFSAGTAEKPVFGFFNASDHKMDYYGTLKAIRPRK